MSDKPPVIVDPAVAMPAVTLEAPDVDTATVRKTGEQLPIGDVSNRHLSKQVTDLRRVIEDKFQQTIDVFGRRIDDAHVRIDGYSSQFDQRINQQHNRLEDHAAAINDHDSRLVVVERKTDVPLRLSLKQPAAPSPTVAESPESLAAALVAAIAKLPMTAPAARRPIVLPWLISVGLAAILATLLVVRLLHVA